MFLPDNYGTYNRFLVTLDCKNYGCNKNGNDQKEAQSY